jgi:acetyl-CoA acetyltransferase
MAESALSPAFHLDGRVAVAGVGETMYYRRGASPDSEFVLACKAVIAAARDAGIDVREIDGFCSYSDDRNDPVRLAAALGIPDVTFANMVWGGGGGGVCAAVANAAAALVAGYAKYVVVYRALAQGQFGRFGRGPRTEVASGQTAYVFPYGLMTPAQLIAMRTMRFMHDHGVGYDPLAAIALTSYRHAQRNPRAVMYGRPLTREMYNTARWIVEPFRLYDCCQENDGAAALILTTAERARDLPRRAAYVMAAAQGLGPRYSLFGQADLVYGAANFRTVAARLWSAAGIGPRDVDVAQVYENFTGGVLLALVEHGFCAPEEVEEFVREENLAWPDGRLPMNTSGGNLAECYMHGLGLVIEAVRQVRGESTCQVEDAEISLVVGGPAASPVSSVVFRR